MVDTVGAAAEAVTKVVEAGERIADRLDEQRAELGTASNKLRAPLPEPTQPRETALDLLDKADVLLTSVGDHPSDLGFQQSAISQAADLVREAIRRAFSESRPQGGPA